MVQTRLYCATCAAFVAAFVCNESMAQSGLDRFKSAISPQEIATYRRAISSCVAEINRRVGHDKSYIMGPCGNEKGEWKAITKSGDSLVLKLAVGSEFAKQNVIVTCETDPNGVVRSFRDKDKSWFTQFTSELDGVCYPAGQERARSN